MSLYKDQNLLAFALAGNPRERAAKMQLTEKAQRLATTMRSPRRKSGDSGKLET